jgi:hypothetical protein
MPIGTSKFKNNEAKLIFTFTYHIKALTTTIAN